MPQMWQTDKVPGGFTGLKSSSTLAQISAHSVQPITYLAPARRKVEQALIRCTYLVTRINKCTLEGSSAQIERGFLTND
jgi:hypothetical protein